MCAVGQEGVGSGVKVPAAWQPCFKLGMMTDLYWLLWGIILHKLTFQTNRL